MGPDEPTSNDRIRVRSGQAFPNQDRGTMPGVGGCQAGQKSMEIISRNVGPEALFGQLQSEESYTGRRIISNREWVQMPHGASARERRAPIL